MSLFWEALAAQIWRSRRGSGHHGSVILMYPIIPIVPKNSTTLVPDTYLFAP
jgi:hypothetical protein